MDGQHPERHASVTPRSRFRNTADTIQIALACGSNDMMELPIDCQSVQPRIPAFATPPSPSFARCQMTKATLSSCSCSASL